MDFIKLCYFYTYLQFLLGNKRIFRLGYCPLRRGDQDPAPSRGAGDSGAISGCSLAFDLISKASELLAVTEEGAGAGQGGVVVVFVSRHVVCCCCFLTSLSIIVIIIEILVVVGWLAF